VLEEEASQEHVLRNIAQMKLSDLQARAGKSEDHRRTNYSFFQISRYIFLAGKGQMVI